MGDLIGYIIKGYEFNEQIGTGGFGAIYKAHDINLNRSVAVKAILPKHANNPDFIRRFEVEAELVAKLEHPFIVPLYDYWREPDSAYLVMRYLPGGNLKNLLKTEPLSLDRVIRILDQIGDALSYAHRHGVVHRDIKPENILLDDEEHAYLADFGIAKQLELPGDTFEGDFKGSLYYSSPEQLKSEDINPQSDIYALGLVIYELLTGTHAFHDSTISGLVSKHLYEPLPRISFERPDLPESLQDIIDKATAKEANDRYVDARDLTLALHDLLRGESVLLGYSIAPDSITEEFKRTNPYKGLRAFQEYDRNDFHGRDKLIEQLLGRINEARLTNRFLAVVGPSGSGKSSVVKAGLIPALREGEIPGSEKWFIVEMLPGSHPFEELEAVLLHVAINPPNNLIEQLKKDERGLTRTIKRILPLEEDYQLVLIIDQFEEIFTLVESEEDRALFLNSILAAVHEPRSRLQVVITLRADFYDRPLRYPGFGELVQQNMETIMPLSEEEIEAAIINPATRVNAALENGLANAIITDIGKQPGALPLLQYALTEVFEHRNGRMLTLAAYREIGGVSGALARRADEIYESLDKEKQNYARQLFLRLVTLGEGSEDTRRRVSNTEFADGSGQLDEIIEAFGNARLLTFDRDPLTRVPTVEIAHEALIGAWERLREWINQNRDQLRLHRRLAAATKEWLEADEEPGLLAHQTRLERFIVGIDQSDIGLNRNEQRYIQLSIDARNERTRQEEIRKAREAETSRRARNFRRVAVAVFIFSLISILLILARSNADLQTEAATLQASISTVEYNTYRIQAESDFMAVRATAQQFGAEFPDISPEHYYATATAQAETWQPISQEFEGVEMVLVPAGGFWMGSSLKSDETPHYQIIDNSFWIDVYEVTNEQFEQFKGKSTFPPDGDDPKQPRTSITWYEAAEFCKNRGARLPTEVEWEYAARGPMSLIYPWGNEWNDQYVVYYDNSRQGSQIVGSKMEGASWIGAFDLSGNVWEWVNSAYEPYPYVRDDGREIVDTAEDLRRVRRGGGWYSNLPDFLRSAYRDWYYPTNYNADLGFRCAQSQQ